MADVRSRNSNNSIGLVFAVGSVVGLQIGVATSLHDTRTSVTARSNPVSRTGYSHTAQKFDRSLDLLQTEYAQAQESVTMLDNDGEVVIDDSYIGRAAAAARNGAPPQVTEEGKAAYRHYDGPAYTLDIEYDEA